MNLYKISQTANSGYDTFDSAIVAAASEQEARQIVPHRKYWEPQPEYFDWRDMVWTSPENVSVVLIGKAAEGTPSGVILASFNAG